MESATMHLQMTDDGNELNGLCLLVVEDDYLVAADMCAALMRRGAVIIGPASNLPRTRELLREHRPDCALLDLNLNGVLAFELLDDTLGWAWGYAGANRRVGYVESDKISA